jgi:hypothetical protein
VGTSEQGHPDAGQLRAFAAGRLTGAELAAVGKHLEECERCCAALDEQAGLAEDAFIHRLKEVQSGLQAAAPAGEPTPARRVGWAERLRRWARRKLVVASLLGL